MFSKMKQLQPVEESWIEKKEFVCGWLTDDRQIQP